LDIVDLILRQLSEQQTNPRDGLSLSVKLSARFDSGYTFSPNAAPTIREQHRLPNANAARPLTSGENEATMRDSESRIENERFSHAASDNSSYLVCGRGSVDQAFS
jgi:hypothetical protein